MNNSIFNGPCLDFQKLVTKYRNKYILFNHESRFNNSIKFYKKLYDNGNINISEFRHITNLFYDISSNLNKIETFNKHINFSKQSNNFIYFNDMLLKKVDL